MATRDETRPTGDGAGGEPPKRQPGWVRPAKRYGPIVAVLAVVAVLVAVFAGGDGDDGGDGTAAGEGGTTEDLIASGPMTWQRAEQEGVTGDIDWGANCDTETGRIRLPTVYAAPCVEPFEGDNGGATATGVTEDTVKIVVYIADPELDPLFAALIGGAGGNLDPAVAQETIQDYADLYNQVYETYGRTVEIEFFTGTGAGDDEVAARNDAIAIAEMEPFAVIGGPNQESPTFTDELTARGVPCLGGCALALPESILSERQPFALQGATTADQGSLLAAEAISNLAPPGPAELAGDPEMEAQDRVYGLVHFDTADGDYEEAVGVFRDGLAEGGIEIGSDVPYQLDLARLQENARTMISRLQADGVTTVLYFGDPITPATLTQEATAQGYFPEWILGPNLLADTNFFARQFDQQQWENAFGVAIGPTAGATEVGTPFSVYEWAYGTEPPSNVFGVLEPPLRNAFTGVTLAGPELTPESFRDGLFRYPPSGGGPTTPLLSWGDHGIWSGTDYGGGDDASIIWWDPEAESIDEVGNTGVGSYRFANGGARYTLGNFPASAEEAGLFDVESSEVQIFDPPPEDQAPDYEPPAGL